MKVLRSIAVALILVASSDVARAQHAYTGVFRAGNDGNYLWVGTTWASFNTKWQQLSGQGLRLVDFDTDVVNGQRRYTGVWRAGSDAHYLWVGVTWSSFVAKWTELSGKGLRLIDLETYVDGGVRRYAGVWRAGTDGHYLWAGVSWQDFLNKWNELSKNGLRLIDFEAYQVGGSYKYAGVFRAGNDGHYLWVATWSNFVQKWNELSAAGLRLIDIESYVDGSTRLYAGVFRAGTGGHGLWASADWENFEARWHSWGQSGLRLVDIERLPGCSGSCQNQVVSPDPYNYMVTGDRFYRWPVDSDASGDYVRLTAVHFSVPSFLTLPVYEHRGEAPGNLALRRRRVAPRDRLLPRRRRHVPGEGRGPRTSCPRRLGQLVRQYRHREPHRRGRPGRVPHDLHAPARRRERRLRPRMG